MDRANLTACIVCNGEIRVCSEVKELVTQADLLIAADGGARHLEELEFHPDVIIGDMDSLDQRCLDRFTKTEIKRFPVRKDKTDTELAVELARKRGAGRIILLGGFGGRPDHVLGHLSLLAKHPGTLEIWARGMRIIALRDGMGSNINLPPGKLVSLMPFPEAHGVTTRGLEYPLEGESLTAGTRGISNRVTGPDARIRVKSGLLLLCMEKKSGYL